MKESVRLVRSSSSRFCSCSCFCFFLFLIDVSNTDLTVFFLPGLWSRGFFAEDKEETLKDYLESLDSSLFKLKAVQRASFLKKMGLSRNPDSLAEIAGINEVLKFSVLLLSSTVFKLTHLLQDEHSGFCLRKVFCCLLFCEW